MTGMSAKSWKPTRFALSLLAFSYAGCASRGPTAPSLVPLADVVMADKVAHHSPTSRTPFAYGLEWGGLQIGPAGDCSFGSEEPTENFVRGYIQPDGEEKLHPLPGLFTEELRYRGKILSPVGGLEYAQIFDFPSRRLRTSWQQRFGSELVEVRRELRTDASLQTAIFETWIKTKKIENLEAIPRLFQMVIRPETSERWSAGKAQIVASHKRGLMGDQDVLHLQTNIVSSDFSADLLVNSEPFPDIEIDGPMDDQQIVRSMLYHVVSSLGQTGGHSVGPFGLSNSLYYGHVFWDADVWVFPTVALLAPQRARSITDYRLARVDQARRNHAEWMKAGQPTAKGWVGMNNNPRLKSGIKFPWESSLTGKETVPGPSRFQDHISGSVLWSLYYGAALGLVDEPLTHIAAGVNNFYLARSKKYSAGLRNIRATMSPDENKIADNDLYTNILAERASEWAKNPERYERPRDAEGLLNYEQDQMRGYKQAAGLLAVYPLQDPEAEKQGLKMLERFADKVIKNGPAMSHSIFATIEARNGMVDRAYETWRSSWQPYTRFEMRQFSEKRSTPRTYFVTGAAGSLQTVLYGFAGIRIDDKPQEGAKFERQLKLGKWLSIKPNLPKQWKKITIRSLWILGEPVDVEISATQVKVLPQEKA